MNPRAKSPAQQEAWLNEYWACIESRMPPERALYWADQASDLVRSSKVCAFGAESRSVQGKRCPPMPSNPDEIALAALAEGRRVFAARYETDGDKAANKLALAFAMTALTTHWGRAHSSVMLKPHAGRYNELIRDLGKSTFNNYVHEFEDDYPKESKRAAEYGVRLSTGDYEREEKAA